MITGQGEMQVTEAGAKRESNNGRGRFDLLPYEALEAWARWSEDGAKKYGDRNWEKGLSVKDCINRMCRHAYKAANGWTDEDHLAAVMWNAAAAITMMQRRPDCNDHPWKDAPASVDSAKQIEELYMDAMKAFGTSAGPMTVDQRSEFLDKTPHIPCEAGTDVPLVPIPFILKEDFPNLNLATINQINETIYFRYIACEPGTDIPVVPFPFITQKDLPNLDSFTIDHVNEIIYCRSTGVILSSHTKEKAFATRAKFMPEGE